MITVTQIEETEDGGANARVEFDNEGLQLLVQEGIVAILQQAADKRGGYALDPEPTKSTDMSQKEITAVDLSVLIDSGIDCWVMFDGIGGYVHVTSLDWDDEWLVFNEVKPRMNYWFSGLQLDGDWDIIKRLTKAGFEVEDKWDDHYRIWIGFRITGLQDGYCWPWECDNG